MVGKVIGKCPAETLKSWRYGGFLEGIESIEIAFFQQATFMDILKRNILWGNQKLLMVSSLFPSSLCLSHSLLCCFLFSLDLCNFFFASLFSLFFSLLHTHPLFIPSLSLGASQKNERSGGIVEDRLSVCGLLHLNRETFK